MAPLTEREHSLLRQRIYTAALVDGHAHGLVDPHTSSFPFLRGFSEADEDALHLVPHTLSFKRSLREIAKLYGCNASLENVQAYRRTLTMEALCSKCFESSNLSAVLIDDGLQLDKMYALDWHKCVFPNVYRVLRIETLAENILNEGVSGGVKWTFNEFLDRFMSALKEISEKVVAFKSIAAYRGGLNIDSLVSKAQAEAGFERCLQAGLPVRIVDKCLVDFIFLCGLEAATLCGLPMQIHTGFGDKDLDLSLANPLHLRPILEDKRFSKSRLVLLHASYPFSKEASYLSSVYVQVYLDFGLAVPKLSVKGMHSAVSELLELAPLNKVMFSTDAYALPETFFLGIKWARETLLHVLGEACANGDFSLEEALKAASDILGDNAMALYRLNQPLEEPTNQGSQGSDSLFLGNEKVVKHVRLLWSDGSGQRRCRVVPKERFERVTKLHGVGLPMCCMAMSSHRDDPAEGCGLNAVGEVRLLPDVTSKCAIPWSTEEELVLVDMHVTPGYPWEYCPRSALKRLSGILQEEFGLIMKVGFESEFYILKPDSEAKGKWIGLDTMPYCCSTSFDGASSMLFEVSKALSLMGVNIEQLHAEAGCGQFEIALHYEPCLKAADDVLILRETVKALIQKHGLLATFLPKMFPDDIGSGSHVHLSLWQGDRNIFMADSSSGSQFGMSKIGAEFMAGVFHHLPSILAFTAPLPNSYERIKPHTWSGAYHCWGRENREASLRASCPPGTHHDVVSNFELKCFDGCANPHLGLAAIMTAGIDGLRKHLRLPEPIDDDPSALSEGVVSLLPISLDQAVAALQHNEILKESLGLALVKCIIAVRQSEIEFYKKQKDCSTMLALRY